MVFEVAGDRLRTPAVRRDYLFCDELAQLDVLFNLLPLGSPGSPAYPGLCFGLRGDIHSSHAVHFDLPADGIWATPECLGNSAQAVAFAEKYLDLTPLRGAEPQILLFRFIHLAILTARS